MNRRARNLVWLVWGAWICLLWIACESLKASIEAVGVAPQSMMKQIEQEQERAHTRQQFQKNFRDLQLTTQGLLHEHEATRLTPQRLNKDSKMINRCAKTLRTMMALGNLAKPIEIDKQIIGPHQFDEALRKLSKLVWDFAHNPVHQNSKVFNTSQAARAQTDLLAIIALSKVLEAEAKAYAPYTTSAQSQP